MVYVPRALAHRLRSFLATFPVTLIVGPRQVGKSTFVRHELLDHAHYDLERPADAALITADPELFFRDHPGPICIDEVQRTPALFPVIRWVVDQHRTPGILVLLGSAAPPLLRVAAETLTGRLGILELSSFSTAELAPRTSWRERWLWGGLPPIYELQRAEARALWLSSYVATLIERDLPQLGVRVPAARIRALWTMLTHINGGLLNLAALARSLQLSGATVRHYLDILEGALMLTSLRPYFANVGKRLTRSPKIYFRDTGILHCLANVSSSRALDTWPGRGASFETLVLMELMAAARNQLPDPRFWFWRTQAGAEVDLLIESGGELLPVEVKHASAVSRYDIAGLTQAMRDLNLARGFVIYRGTEQRKLAANVWALPWDEVANGSSWPWQFSG